jgi:hypothetical protein
MAASERRRSRTPFGGFDLLARLHTSLFSEESPSLADFCHTPCLVSGCREGFRNARSATSLPRIFEKSDEDISRARGLRRNATSHFGICRSGLLHEHRNLRVHEFSPFPPLISRALTSRLVRSRTSRMATMTAYRSSASIATTVVVSRVVNGISGRFRLMIRNIGFPTEHSTISTSSTNSPSRRSFASTLVGESA